MSSLPTTVLACIAVALLAPAAAPAREDVPVPLSAQEAAIQNSIAMQLSSKAQWAFIAIDLETGRELIKTGSSGQRQFIPGSLMKLFVTAAVLEQNRREAIDLGTTIAVHGEVTKSRLDGDIIVAGAGNAFLSTRDLSEAIEKIKSLGIKEIRGNVIIDDSFFDVADWKSRYRGSSNGMPSALGLDMHTVSVTAASNPLKVSIDPPNNTVKIRINQSGKADIRQIDDHAYEVAGVTPKAATVQKRFPLSDPALYAGGAFLTLLRKQGIVVAGTVRRGVLPAGTTEVARVGSRDMDAFIRDTNRHSPDVAEDNLLFLLGAVKYGAPGTREKGVRAVSDFLGDAGMTPAGLVMDDGSGLSQRNRMAPDDMVMLLRAAARKPWFPSFAASLSRPGMDGRLADFGYRSDRMQLKSVQVRDAYCLAGYVEQGKGGTIAFAFMVNGTEANTPAASNAAVEILRQLEQ